MRFNSCPLCEHANPVTARACEACGVGMVTACADCGTVDDASASRCKRCGAVLPAGADDIASRADETASASPRAALPLARARARSRERTRPPIAGKVRWRAATVTCSLAAALAAGIFLLASRSPATPVRSLQPVSLPAPQAIPPIVADPSGSAPTPAAATPSPVATLPPAADTDVVQPPVSARPASAVQRRRLPRAPDTTQQGRNGPGEAAVTPAASQADSGPAPPPVIESMEENPPSAGSCSAQAQILGLCQ